MGRRAKRNQWGGIVRDTTPPVDGVDDDAQETETESLDLMLAPVSLNLFMQVKAVHRIIMGGGVQYMPGTVFDIDKNEGRQLVECGACVEVAENGG